MKSSTFSSVILGGILLLLVTGCGKFTKMRYSRGFKSNIEFRFNKKSGEPEKRNIAAKAIKKQNTPVLTRPSEATVTGIEIRESTSTLLIQKIKKNFTVFPKNTRIKSTIPIPESHKVSQHSTLDIKPMEPKIKLAGTFFTIYLLIYVAAIIIFIALLLGTFTIDPFLGLVLLFLGGLIGAVSSVLSFVFAIIGLSNMRKARGEYRGAVLAIFILVWFLIFTLLPALSALLTIFI